MLNFRNVTEVVSIVILLYGLILYARIWRGIKNILLPMDILRLKEYFDFMRFSRKIQNELKNIVIAVAIIFLINIISVCFCVLTEIQLIILFLAFTLFIMQNSAFNMFCTVTHIKKEERKYYRECRKNMIESQIKEINNKDDTSK